MLMKHTLPITMALLGLFLISQLIGLGLIAVDAKTETRIVGNQTITVVYHNATVIGERPQLKGFQSLLYVLIAIGIGTVALLFLAAKKVTSIWRAWFFIAVWMAMAIALGVIIPKLYAWIIAFILTLLKLLKPRFMGLALYNLSEILVYAGIVVLLAPLFKPPIIAMLLLILISFYDYWAVNRSKHMVRLARFQALSNAFAGLSLSKPQTLAEQNITKSKQASKEPVLNYKNKKHERKHQKTPAAILGGGDITFPMIFAASVLESLIASGFSKTQAFIHVLPIPLITTIALGFLFFKASKERFYPAMPAITIGCFIGWLILLVF